jgi:hypothetical protein
MSPRLEFINTPFWSRVSQVNTEGLEILQVVPVEMLAAGHQGAIVVPSSQNR